MIYIFYQNYYPYNTYPLGTTMRPHLAVELTYEQIIWEGLKHFYCGFTRI